MTPPGGYRRRIVDSELDFLIANLFAVAIDGPKAVGKTATAEQRAATVHRLDTDPLDLIEADPSRLTDAPEPILIDEWQHWPPSWDFVRRAVDDDPRPGRFILTGSTSLRNPQTHSGAGRIVSLRMRPLTLPERGEVSPAVSFADLLSEQAGKITGDTAYGLEDYTEQIVGGGFPGMQSLTTAAKAAQLDGYIRRIVERDFPEAGTDVRPTEGPKHNLADPALAAALLGASVRDLLTGRPVGLAVPRDGHLLGALFESLVALSLRVFAQAAGAEVHHLRTKNTAHEVDFIVTGRGERSAVGVEVKVSSTVKPDDVRHLHWLKAQMGDQLTDMVLVNTGRYAYRRPDGVAVVPLALLGA